MNTQQLFLSLASAILATSCGSGNSTKQDVRKPNFIVFFCDDLGFGDIGPFGHPSINTPNLERMAEEGQKWTNFYASAPVCTPSRAGLLTGRYAIRSGMCGEKRRVLFPDSEGGLPVNEITIAEELKTVGYSTACIGKWHLGHLQQFSPNSQGFDYYFGIPYSNDMDRIEGIDHYQACANPKVEFFQVPLMRNAEIIEKPADQTTITKRYTDEAIKFIVQNKDKPFFLYMAHSMPHVPLFRSKDFKNKSLRGIFGDVIEELDWSIGQVLDQLRKSGLDKNTLVVFTSDNGPWLTFKEQGGSSGLLKGGKGGTFEGGVREPTIFWWPGKLKHKVIMDISSTLDLFPTISKLAGATVPADRIYDGYDLSPVMFESGKTLRSTFFYYRDTEVFAVRKGQFKAHFKTRPEFGDTTTVVHNPPLLFNIDVDPSEQYNIASQHTEIIEDIKKVLKGHQKSVVPVENQLEKVMETAGGAYQKKSL